MNGVLSPKMCWMLDFELKQIDHYDQELKVLQEEIRTLLIPCAEQMNLLCSIPGIGKTVAAQILAEIGTDLSAFSSGDQLAAWAGSPPEITRAREKSQPVSCTETAIRNVC